jgi:hypothetical protein
MEEIRVIVNSNKERSRFVSELLKFLFEQVTDPLTLPISPVAEWIVLLIINGLVYRMAYCLVGDLYSFGCISGSAVGKVAHWILRTICFFIIWGVVSAVIIVGQFVINNWMAITIGTLVLVGLWIVSRKVHVAE